MRWWTGFVLSLWAGAAFAQSSATLEDRNGRRVAIPRIEMTEVARWDTGVQFRIFAEDDGIGSHISPFGIIANGQNATRLGEITISLTELEDDRLGTVRLEAEAELKRRLPISDSQLCALNINVWTGKTSRFATGSNLGLSFCPGSTVLPIGTSTVRLPPTATGYIDREWWAAPVAPRVASPFFDPTYPTDFDRQHLGVDLTAASGSAVVSPVQGYVRVNRTSHADVNQAYLVIEDMMTETEHVLGHISSDLAVETFVSRGERVGTVRPWPNEPSRSHVHWGANRRQARPVGSWGWGRAPAAVTEVEAVAQGWVNLNPALNAEPSLPYTQNPRSPTLAQVPMPLMLTCDGPIQATTTEADLRRLFGQGNLSYEVIPRIDNMEERGTVLFGADPLRRAMVIWRDDRRRAGVERVIVTGNGWQARDGLRVGSPINDVERANGRPFKLSGFGSDYGSHATDWRGGRLDPPQHGCRTIIELGEDHEAGGQPTSDYDNMSDSPAVRSNRPRIVRIDLFFGFGT